MQQLLLKVLERLAIEAATPRAHALFLRAWHGEWAQLLEQRTDPSAYHDASTYFADVKVTDFLRKCKLPWVKGRQREEAVKTFWAMEAQCAETNSRLRKFLPGFALHEPSDRHIWTFVDQVRKEISRVLGPLPPQLELSFSPGATLSDKGKFITLPSKLSSRPTIYKRSIDLLPYWHGTMWGQLHEQTQPLRTNNCNEFFTVPKDCKTDRGCCKEASVNITMQLGVGGAIRRRLLKTGVDLERDQAYHNRLARKGSIDGSLATIDLSSASDTISRVLVELLLPADWFELLDSLRATHTKIDGKRVRLEKFSSMGNGFTFELETLIFLALARVCGSMTNSFQRESAYGDDIIVGTETAPLLLKVLKFFGFTPNERKTFIAGRFRESCGGDYFDGADVSPYRLKSLPTEPHQLIALANGLTRNLSRTARKAVLDDLPSNIRQCRGPVWLGDLVIHDEPSKWRTRTKYVLSDPDSNREIRVWAPVARRYPLSAWRPPVALCAAVLGASSSGVTPRGDAGVTGHRFRWLTIGSSDSSVAGTWMPG